MRSDIGVGAAVAPHITCSRAPRRRSRQRARRLQHPGRRVVVLVHAPAVAAAAAVADHVPHGSRPLDERRWPPPAASPRPPSLAGVGDHRRRVPGVGPGEKCPAGRSRRCGRARRRRVRRRRRRAAHRAPLHGPRPDDGRRHRRVPATPSTTARCTSGIPASSAQLHPAPFPHHVGLSLVPGRRGRKHRGDAVGPVAGERVATPAPLAGQPAAGERLHGMTPMPKHTQVGRTSLSIPRTRIEYGGCSTRNARAGVVRRPTAPRRWRTPGTSSCRGTGPCPGARGQ